jgi:hypothetical protein
MKKLEKYIIPIVICIILIAFVFLIFPMKSIKKETKNKKIGTAYFNLAYNTSWNLKEKKDEIIEFEHSSGSKLIIKTNKLDIDKEYLTIDDLIADIVYELNNSNKEYKMINDTKEELTKNSYPGYKLLYEKENSQLLISIFKQSNKIIIITYEATNEYFDSLLDSVNEIIYNLEIEEEAFDIKEKINLQLSPLSLPKDNATDKLLYKTVENTIYQNNYKIKYQKPDILVNNKLQSDYDLSYYSDYPNRIDLNIRVSKLNIYEILDHEKTGNIYSSYNYYSKDKATNNFQERVSRYDKDSYIYSNEYIEKSSYSDRITNHYNLVVLKPLDKNHTLYIEISSTNLKITEKLVKMIKIEEITNYAENVTTEKEGDNKVFELKVYDQEDKTKTHVVKVKIPSKYSEIDLNENVYEKRKFYYGYNSKRSVNNYEVTYSLSKLTEENNIKTYNNSYIIHSNREYSEVSFVENLTLNDIEFKKYSGWSTEIGGIMFTTINRDSYRRNAVVLTKEIVSRDDLGRVVLVIIVEGNGYEISDEILQELSQVEIKEERRN